PLASNALAIRIIFPSVGVIQVSFNLTGLPASLGKQKRDGPWAISFFMLPRFSANSSKQQSTHWLTDKNG
ncbi:hypothetical protein L2749_21010, partial [Shewanella algicola]|nr:hypothetical protein [Shewanella algicola]